MQLFGNVTQGLSTAIDLYQARHTVLAENIANSETPGYRARELDFGNALAEALATPEPTAPGDASSVAPTRRIPEPTIDREAAVKPDGNSVAIDEQVGRLAENAFKIQALTQIIAARYQGLRRVIDGGKG